MRTRPGRRRPARSSGCCSTSTTSTPSTGWDPEDAPAVGARRAAPTTRWPRPPTRCGAATAPAAEAEERLPRRRRPPTWERARPTTSWRALDALDGGGRPGSSRAATLRAHQPRQGAVPGRATDEAPVTKRDLIRYHAAIAPVDAALPGGPAGQPAPVPERRRQGRASGTRRCRRTRPTGSPGGTTTTPTRRDRSGTSSPTASPRWCGWRTTAPSSCTRGRRRREPHEPTWALIDIDPGPKTTFDDVAGAGPPVPHGARAPRRRSACPR